MINPNEKSLKLIILFISMSTSLEPRDKNSSCSENFFKSKHKTDPKRREAASKYVILI
jgi:hypothetical protein